MRVASILCFVAIVFLPAPYAFSVVRAGLGLSTVTSGRQIPALEIGLDVSDWSVSGMFAGARTTAYYTSGIMANVLRTSDWGEFWFGRLEVGFGGGAFHGEKGIYTEIDDDGTLSNLQKNQDNVVGPAFRVSFKPVAHVHVSLEFLMGIGTSLVSNAWEDVGIGTLGFDL